MADEVIRISGIEETCAALDALPKRIVKNAFARALTAAAVPIVRALESRVPHEHGDLAAHLVTDIAIDAQGRGGTLQVGFGKEGWKARLVEFGHRMVGHKPAKKQLGQVRAHPFMAPALMDAADEAIDAFAESLAEQINQGV